jgi:lipoprotein-anchoring transpeptidase ErfK/SrfK
MNHDDSVERRLADALAARAYSAVPENRTPPPFTGHPTRSTAARHSHRAGSGRRHFGWLAPLAAAAAVIVVVGGLFAFRQSATRQVNGAGVPATSASTGAGSSGAHGQPAPTSTVSTPTAAPVHVKLKFSDGSQFGVGIPIIAYLSKKISDGSAFAKATEVTVNGQPAAGAWFFETSVAQPGYPLEAHYRLQNYWPAHSKISMNLPVNGLSAGRGLAFDDSLTLDFVTGPANIATVDDTTHTLSLVSDGKPVGTYPVSLGANNTPTARGVKVIMEKGASICMSGPGYHECGVKWTQRLTYGGEYLHAAPWNLGHLGKVDSSNGCTNLSDGDAKTLYDRLEIGDVVKYPNANGPSMSLGAGYGDWNVPWPQWLTGGAVPTR